MRWEVGLTGFLIEWAAEARLYAVLTGFSEFGRRKQDAQTFYVSGQGKVGLTCFLYMWTGEVGFTGFLCK